MMTNKKYFAFSYGDEQEKAILIWLPIEYMFAKRDCFIKISNIKRDCKNQNQTIKQFSKKRPNIT